MSAWHPKSVHSEQARISQSLTFPSLTAEFSKYQNVHKNRPTRHQNDDRNEIKHLIILHNFLPLCKYQLQSNIFFWLKTFQCVDLYNIKMTNSLRLTHHVLLCVRLHVSVLSDHHQALLWIKSRNAGYILGSQLCLQLVPVYISVI